ncbi:MAG: hypothetical protein DWQ01_02565 [Planctomycetota bacterium]|nr:MAG: hypothetical protein DWQ01_02565 [Planctomycetota bacterium]
MNNDKDRLLWPPRDDEEVAIWLNARLDGECTPAQEGWLANYIQDHPKLAKEWASLERTRLIFETARLKEPTDHERQALEKALAPNLIRDLGWVLVVFGLVVLMAYGGFLLWTDQGTPLSVRVGLGAFAGGLLILIIRHGWERLRLMKIDPYQEVQR